MKNYEFDIVVFIIIISVVAVFFLYNTFVSFYNKKKLEQFLKDCFIRGDIESINRLDFCHRKISEKFGKNDSCPLSEKDEEELTKILGFKVKAYDKSIMSHFFGGTLYSETKGYEDIEVHHIVFRVYKCKYISIIGEKEYFSIIVERHNGSCVWDGQKMHYPYNICSQTFQCTPDDMEQTWMKVKEYMFA